MKSTAPNADDEIEVDEIKVIGLESSLWGRIRIRERSGVSGYSKCSIFLTPVQLEEHAQTCLALAARIRMVQPSMPLCAEDRPVIISLSDLRRRRGALEPAPVFDVLVEIAEAALAIALLGKEPVDSDDEAQLVGWQGRMVAAERRLNVALDRVRP